MRCISFGKFSFSIIFLVCIPIIGYLNTIMAYPLYKNGFTVHSLFFCVQISCGQFVLGGILEFISYILRRNNLTKGIETYEVKVTTLPGFQAYQKKDIWSKCLIISLIIGLGSIDFLGYVAINFTSMQTSKAVLGHQLKTSQIIFTGLFSTKILGIPFYLHHIIAIIAILIGIVIISTDVIIELGFDFVTISIFLTVYILFSLKDVGEKWLMNNKYWSPFKLLMYEGLVGIFVSIWVFLAGYLVTCQKGWLFCEEGKSVESIPLLFSKVFSRDLFWYCLMLLFSNGALNVCNIMTNHFMSPTHKSIGDTISSYVLSTNMLLDNQKKLPVMFNWYMIIVGDLLILLASLIFNESIVFYCCNMHMNTKVEIMKRSEDDANYPKMDINESQISLVVTFEDNPSVSRLYIE